MESAFVDCEYVGECELRAVRSTLESGWLSGGVRPGRNALGWDAAINPARLARWERGPNFVRREAARGAASMAAPCAPRSRVVVSTSSQATTRRFIAIRLDTRSGVSRARTHLPPGGLRGPSTNPPPSTTRNSTGVTRLRMGLCARDRFRCGAKREADAFAAFYAG